MVKHMKRTRKTCRGFSLVEAAIILGVVGLVIGAIWAVAADVRNAEKINATAKGLLFTASEARRLFPLANYPTTNGVETTVTSALYNAGALPRDFTYTSGSFATAPSGVKFRATLGCWGAVGSNACPALMLYSYSPSALAGSSFSKADCIQLIGKFGTLAKDSSNLSYVAINNPGGQYQLLTPPFSTSAIDCPDDFTMVVFWFKP